MLKKLDPLFIKLLNDKCLPFVFSYLDGRQIKTMGSKEARLKMDEAVRDRAWLTIAGAYYCDGGRDHLVAIHWPKSEEPPSDMLCRSTRIELEELPSDMFCSSFYF